SPSAPSMPCCTRSRASPARWSTPTLRSPVLTRMTCWPTTGRPRPRPDGHGHAGRPGDVRVELRAVSVQLKVAFPRPVPVPVVGRAGSDLALDTADAVIDRYGQLVQDGLSAALPSARRGGGSSPARVTATRR